MSDRNRDKRITKGELRILFLLATMLLVSVWGGAKQTSTSNPKGISLNKTDFEVAVEDTKKVVLDYADSLIYDNKLNPDFQILKGNVQFHRGGMKMFCDSAYFYDQTNSMDAYGNVRMEQGDTLFVFSDVMYYNGDASEALLRNNVKLQNRLAWIP